MVSALLFVLLTAAPSRAAVSAPATVAAVSASDFSAGRHWQWNYFDSSGNIYSSERYTVIANVNGVVTLEMASHFPGETVFKPTHRIMADVSQCLGSYANPANKKIWAMRMFFLDNGQWTEIEPPSTLAFEEKFNCNPYRLDSSEYLTVFKDSPVGQLFEQKRWRRLDSSWFMSGGTNAAVVYEKEFPHGSAGDTYRMQMD